MILREYIGENGLIKNPGYNGGYCFIESNWICRDLSRHHREYHFRYRFPLQQSTEGSSYCNENMGVRIESNPVSVVNRIVS
jgi:hypothetical protein